MIRASSMNRIMKCAASYNLQKGYPNDDSEASEEGTLAHAWGKYKLNGGTENPQDPEMTTHVESYVHYCQSWIKQYPHALMGVEVPLSDGQVPGTPDFFIWTPYELVIVDLKYGYGWVEAYLNWQLLTYAILVWLTCGNQGQVIPPKVRLVVVQPRANHPGGPVRDWCFEGELLRNCYNQIQNRIAEIQLGVETADPGKHCRDCRALVDCNANREYVSHLIDLVYKPEKTDMSPPELGRELDILYDVQKMLVNRLTAVETRAEERLKAGDLVPGYAVTQGVNPLSWDVPDPVAAGYELGVNLEKGDPITPTQAINRGLLSEEMVNMMASKKPGKFKLKRQNLDFVKKLMAGAV